MDKSTLYEEASTADRKHKIGVFDILALETVPQGGKHKMPHYCAMAN